MSTAAAQPHLSPGEPPIALIATDLDGTLWDARGHVHPRTAAALQSLADRGVPVLAATSRRPASARQLLVANGLLLPAVLFDGSLGVDFASGTTFHRAAFAPDAAAAVLDTLLACELEPCVNIDAEPHDVLVGPRPATHPAHLRFVAPWRQDVDLHVSVRTLTVLSFVICGGDPAVLNAALARTAAFADGSVSRDLTYGGATLSIRPPGVSKWQGVLAFCRVNGLDARRVLAIGDGDNDVELLASAAIACAVADGTPAARRAAQHEVAPAHEGGWATLLELLALS